MSETVIEGTYEISSNTIKFVKYFDKYNPSANFHGRILRFDVVFVVVLFFVVNFVVISEKFA